MTNIVTRMKIPMPLFCSDLNDKYHVVRVGSHHRAYLSIFIYSICDIQCVSCTIILPSVMSIDRISTN